MRAPIYVDGVLVLLLYVAALCRGYASAQVAFAPPSAQWMALSKADIANMTLSELVMPGTHDTGTYALVDQPSPDVPLWVQNLLTVLKDLGITEPYTVINNWAQTQESVVFQQLHDGARFLDVRVCWDGGSASFRTLHFILGDKTENMLADMAQFLSYFPEEVLVLQWGDFAAFNDTLHDNLVSMIQQYLGSYGLFPKSLASRLATEHHDITSNLRQGPVGPNVAGIESRVSGSRPGEAANTPGFSFTYSDMIKFGKRVLLLYDDTPTAERYDILWPSDSYLVSDWANVDNFPAMLSYETKSVQDHTGNPNAVYKLQWVLTASARLIIDAVLNPWDTEPTLHALSRTANGNNFDSFVKQTLNYRINLLMTDFQNEVNALDWARVLNRLGCNDNKAYRQTYCRTWKQDGLCNNVTVRELCPLTCDACNWTKVAGKPGDNCTDGNQCMFGLCNVQIGKCLSDYPSLPGQTCGVDSQCWSGNCDNYVCIGAPLRGACSENMECGSLVCGTSRAKYELPVKIKAPGEVETEMEQKGLNSTVIDHVWYHNTQIDQADLKIRRLKMWFEFTHAENWRKGGECSGGLDFVWLRHSRNTINPERCNGLAQGYRYLATLAEHDLCVNALLPFSSYEWRDAPDHCYQEEEPVVITPSQQMLCGRKQ